MNEIWKEFEEGYRVTYLVSNLGNVKSIRKLKSGECKCHVISPAVDKYGYLYVGIHRDGQVKYIKVHRLVAKLFLDNYSDNLQVNHIDEDKKNNRVSNLEMCNNEYNCRYGSRSNEHNKPILQFDLSGNFIQEWPSIKEVSRILDISETSIINCCKGFLKDSHNGKTYPVHKAHGYIWRYKEN